MIYINGQAVAPTNLIKEGHNYSTDEQVVGTWINGKPLYEKTVVLKPYHYAVGVNNYPHGVANVDECFIVSAIKVPNPDFSGTHDENYTTGSINIINGDIAGMKSVSQRAIIWGADETYIQSRNYGYDWNKDDYEAFITIQYTKTTD